MPRRPPKRPTRVDTIGATSIADPTTDRAVAELRELVLRMQQLMVAPTVNRLGVNEVAPVTTINGSVYAFGDELFWRDSDGTVSQLSNQSAGGGGGDTYGDRQYTICLKEVSVPAGSVGAPGDGFTSITTTANNTTLVFGPLMTRLGERPKGCVARVNKNSLGTMTLRWQKSVDGGARSDIGTSATSATSGLQTLTSTVAAPTATVANENYYVTVTCPNSGDQVIWVTFTVDKVS